VNIESWVWNYHNKQGAWCKTNTRLIREWKERRKTEFSNVFGSFWWIILLITRFCHLLPSFFFFSLAYVLFSSWLLLSFFSLSFHSLLNLVFVLHQLWYQSQVVIGGLCPMSPSGPKFDILHLDQNHFLSWQALQKVWWKGRKKKMKGQIILVMQMELWWLGWFVYRYVLKPYANWNCVQLVVLT